VPAGLRIRVVNTQDGSTLVERTFDRSPIRIGRSSINELSINSAFVSQFHAVLEFDGQRIILRDLGSTNGTLLRSSGRVQPNSPVDLTSQNFEFAIVSLWFQLHFVTAVAPVAAVKREGTILSLDYNELQKMIAPLAAGRPSLPSAATGPDRTKELMARVQPMYDEYRASWSKLYREMFSMMTPLDPGARDRMLKQMSVEMAAMQHEGDFQRMSTHFGAAPPNAAAAGSPNATMKDDAVALAALRDLAAVYAPQRGPLEKVVDIVGFAQKVQDLLGVFFKCFLALRDGHKQFKSQLDIKRTFRPNEQLSAARAVETAREPRELAARLLDWSDPSNEGARAIESTFAEVMVHQVAMLSGVMRGVRSLLSKLAPPSIETELENPRRRAASGSTFGPFRYKTLWDLYTEIYGDFAEEKQAFALIFGSEFANAYSELAGGEAAPTGAQVSAGAPSAFGQQQQPAPAFGGQPQGQPQIRPGGTSQVPQQPPWVGPRPGGGGSGGGGGPTQR
jgi:type VI secretion system protein ImpI